MRRRQVIEHLGVAGLGERGRLLTAMAEAGERAVASEGRPKASHGATLPTLAELGFSRSRALVTLRRSPHEPADR